MSKKLYVASPLGFSPATLDYYQNNILKPLSSFNLDVLDPWSMTDAKELKKIFDLPMNGEKLKMLSVINREIAAMNTSAIKSCDGVFAILDGVDVDSGTAAEIGYAAALGKRIFSFRGDFRQTGDNVGARVNLQVQYFIETCGGGVENNIDKCFEQIKNWLSE